LKARTLHELLEEEKSKRKKGSECCTILITTITKLQFNFIL